VTTKESFEMLITGSSRPSRLRSHSMKRTRQSKEFLSNFYPLFNNLYNLYLSKAKLPLKF